MTAPETSVGMSAGPALVIACVVAVFLTMAVRTWLYLRRRARLLSVTESMTQDHARLLSVKQKQLVLNDGYGNYDLAGWISHANYFIDNVILREAKARGIDLKGTAPGEKLRVDITRRFLSIVNRAAAPASPEPEERRPSLAAPASPAIRPGHDYEARCYTLLEGAGWRVSMTPLSGDQGADLIADTAGQRVVIQCKFHAKPVGNKAVQEAYTARNMHGADHAVVVSNNSFTRSAIELARVNDVLLMHHDQLPDLERQLRSKPKTPAFQRPRTGKR